MDIYIEYRYRYIDLYICGFVALRDLFPFSSLNFCFPSLQVFVFSFSFFDISCNQLFVFPFPKPFIRNSFRPENGSKFFVYVSSAIHIFEPLSRTILILFLKIQILSLVVSSLNTYFPKNIKRYFRTKYSSIDVLQTSFLLSKTVLTCISSCSSYYCLIPLKLFPCWLLIILFQFCP